MRFCEVIGISTSVIKLTVSDRGLKGEKTKACPCYTVLVGCLLWFSSNGDRCQAHCHKPRVFFSSQDVEGRLRGVQSPQQRLLSQADGLRVLCARAFRPLASFFVYAGLQLPHEVSCLGKEEMWTVEREKKTNKQKKPQQKTKPFSCEHLLVIWGLHDAEEKIVLFWVTFRQLSCL